jgi:hypothetical protein
VLIAGLLAAGTASAQPKPKKPPPAAPAADPALESAKALFRQGIELFNAGDHERALDFFVRSRAAFPSAVNTTNAAICLDRLGRYDEALEMYEELLTRFGKEIDAAERRAIAPAMAALRDKVGSVDVSANVEGIVVVDGRARGKLPLTSPIRVQPGTRTVRVMRNGYLTQEAKVVVKAGQTEKVDLRLEPLASSGLVRVEDADHAGFEVFVDRVSVGTIPWEGTLAPGKHVVWEQKGDLGSAPVAVQVVQAQTALIRLQSQKLGAMTRVELDAQSAEVSIDGVSVGSGTWEGRLPEGAHTVAVSEEGYRPRSQQILSSSGATPTRLRIALEVDQNHPRWGRRGSFWIGLFGGYGFAPSLGSGAEARCGAGACSAGGLGGGPLVGLRVGYRLPFGLSVELGGAFTYLTRSISRAESATYVGGAQARYALDDQLRVVGPVLLGGVSYRLGIGSTFGLIGRVGAGALFGSASDVVAGKASSGGQTVDATVQHSGQVSRGAAAVVMPELGAELAFGKVRVSLGVAALAVLTDGPALPNGPIQVPSAKCPTSSPSAISCAPDSSVVSGERGYGRSVVVSPQVGVGYSF